MGRVLRAHGIRGEVRVENLSDVEERFVPGTELWLRSRDGRRSRRCIQQVREDRGTLLIHFEGIVDRSRADEIRGAALEVEESEVPEAPEGYFYYFELVGCTCYRAETDDSLGRVLEVLEDGGGHLLRLDHGGSSLLVPFVDAFLRTVDIDAGRIELDLPPGLIETCTSRS
ncbi:MAG: ribosome maturation factor RimM [Holophagales bacterium]|nr:ribosome maturation factor RimM [Holophagales bacterium]